MDGMNLPVLVEHTEIPVEKQMDRIYYVGLNFLLAWAAFTFYKNVWVSDLFFDGYILSEGYVLNCFIKWLAFAVVLGMLLTWRERTAENSIATVLLPFECTIFVHVIQYYRTIAAGIYIALMGAVLAAVTILFVLGLIMTRRKKGRVRKSLIRIRDILVFALAVAIPLYQILKSVMPESYLYAPPAFFAEPSQTRAEMINGVIRFVQSI